MYLGGCCRRQECSNRVKIPAQAQLGRTTLKCSDWVIWVLVRPAAAKVLLSATSRQ
jgi:hypothetical protein